MSVDPVPFPFASCLPPTFIMSLPPGDKSLKAERAVDEFNTVGKEGEYVSTARWKAEVASRISSLATYSVAVNVVGPWRNRSALTKFMATPPASLSASKSSNSVLSCNFCFFAADSPDDELLVPAEVEGRGEFAAEEAGEEDFIFSEAWSTIVEC